MSTSADQTELHGLGIELANFVRSQSSESLSPSVLQGVVSDLFTNNPDLIAPLRDLVSRPSFRALIPLPSSGGGVMQRDALIQEISRVYHPDIVNLIEQILNSFLQISGHYEAVTYQDEGPNSLGNPYAHTIDECNHQNIPDDSVIGCTQSACCVDNGLRDFLGNAAHVLRNQDLEEQYLLEQDSINIRRQYEAKHYSFSIEIASLLLAVMPTVSDFATDTLYEVLAPIISPPPHARIIIYSLIMYWCICMASMIGASKLALARYWLGVISPVQVIANTYQMFSDGINFAQFCIVLASLTAFVCGIILRLPI